MATSILLTEDCTEVLVQYHRRAKTGMPAYPPGFSEATKADEKCDGEAGGVEGTPQSHHQHRDSSGEAEEVL